MRLDPNGADFAALRKGQVAPYFTASLGDAPSRLLAVTSHERPIAAAAVGAGAGDDAVIYASSGNQLLLGVHPPESAHGAQRDFCTVTVSDADWSLRSRLANYVGLTFEWALRCERTDADAPDFILLGWKGVLAHYTVESETDGLAHSRVIHLIGVGPISSYDRDAAVLTTEDQLAKASGHENSDALRFVGSTADIPIGRNR